MAPPWLLLLWVSAAGAVSCPDGTKCGGQSHCCELPGAGGYGCCPPQGEGVSRSLPMVQSRTSCSDPTSCPDEYSCVRTPRGGAACCPLLQASSCQDGRHCCPIGTQCSEDGHSCLPASNISAIICPDGRSECPNDATCCMMVDQTWGCCPMPQAACCDDHQHCCPHDTSCDVQHGKCVSGRGDFPLRMKFPALRKSVTGGGIVRRTTCPDTSSCPDGATCCLQSDGTYGCCPLESAVCCSDHIHCCPQGTVCDVSHQKCVSKDQETPLFTKMAALRGKAATVRCDDTASCADGNTCCRLASGEWGCCPIVQAVCCPDHLHCCPSGFSCDGQGSCVRGELSIPWLSKTAALQEKAATVRCDNATSCADGNTCCRLASGEWGCCPLDKGVCCSDHLHCCPSGYTCDVTSGTCNKPGSSQPAPRVSALQSPGYVFCDLQHRCFDGQTCCRSFGTWNCCPYTQGVCCPDMVHCCPYGYVCYGSGAACVRGGDLRWDGIAVRREQTPLL